MNYLNEESSFYKRLQEVEDFMLRKDIYLTVVEGRIVLSDNQSHTDVKIEHGPAFVGQDESWPRLFASQKYFEEEK